MNTRTVLIALLLSSGCASMPSPEQVRASEEQQRVYEEQERVAREHADARERQKRQEEERKDEEDKRTVDRITAAMERGDMSRAQGFTAIYNVRRARGPLSPEVDELELYGIALAEQVDAGNLTLAQGRYLISKKIAELMARIKKEEEEQAQADEQRRAREQAAIMEMQRAEEQAAIRDEERDFNNRLLLFNALQNRRPVYQPVRPYPNLPLSPQIHCTSRSFLGTVTTDCQ